MNLLLTRRISVFIFFLLVFVSNSAHSQFLMDMIDTTKETGKGLLSIYKRYDHIRIGGYIQTQFQLAESKGAKSFDGGDFGVNVDDRFMIRRGRLKFDYMHFGENTKPSVQFVFQFDGSERGVFIRDFWGRVFENKFKLFSLTTGMFARPFGYELNLSSSDRESPERGRMSQTLMKTERDLGAMVSFEPRDKTNWLKYVKWDVGFFNGQGLNAPGEFDSYKDFISRAGIKPFPLNKNLLLSAAVSYFNGGFIQNNKYKYQVQTSTAIKQFVVDSSTGSVGTELPRKYYGADVQLKWLHSHKSVTELRAEYWRGTQTASAGTSETPAVLLTEPYYVRNFDGAYFYLLHSINKHNQFGIKYDWYDPNTKLSGKEISDVNGGHAADIKYGTFGFGYIYHVDDNLKLLAWYEFVKNESTALTGYTTDLKDNILTLRLQYRF